MRSRSGFDEVGHTCDARHTCDCACPIARIGTHPTQLHTHKRPRSGMTESPGPPPPPPPPPPCPPQCLPSRPTAARPGPHSPPGTPQGRRRGHPIPAGSLRGRHWRRRARRRARHGFPPCPLGRAAGLRSPPPRRSPLASSELLARGRRLRDERRLPDLEVQQRPVAHLRGPRRWRVLRPRRNPQCAREAAGPPQRSRQQPRFPRLHRQR